MTSRLVAAVVLAASLMFSACGAVPDEPESSVSAPLTPGSYWAGGVDSVLSTVPYVCSGQTFRGVMTISQRAPVWPSPFWGDSLTLGLGGIAPPTIAARLSCMAPHVYTAMVQGSGLLYNAAQLNCSLQTPGFTTAVSMLAGNWQYYPATVAEPFGHWDAYITAPVGPPGSGACGNMVLTFRI